MTTPKENLVRVVDIEPIGLRDAGDGSGGRTLFGHFAVFNQWTEINSMWEGNFRERIVPGAFQRTIAERGNKVKVLYDHGKDPQLGNKPLGSIKVLREDDQGVYYEVELLDTSYVNDFILPAARAGLLGASFRFSVAENGDAWESKATRSNPDALDERTIKDLDLFEFGPVTFPAYDAATAGVRGGTDQFLDSLAHDPRFVARFTERAGLKVTETLIDALDSLKTQRPTALVDKKKNGEKVADEARTGEIKNDEEATGDNVTRDAYSDSVAASEAAEDAAEAVVVQQVIDMLTNYLGDESTDSGSADDEAAEEIDEQTIFSAAYALLGSLIDDVWRSQESASNESRTIERSEEKEAEPEAPQAPSDNEVSTDGQTSQPLNRQQALRRNYVTLYGVGKKKK